MLSNPIAVDVETIEILPDGSIKASTEFYREGFRVSSCAFTERRNGEIFSWYAEDEDNIHRELEKLVGRPFVVHNCAFTERRNGEIFSWYVEGEDNVRAELEKLQGRNLVAHNIQFEIGVSRCRFPGLNLNWACDTMRLVQNYDNGGGDDAFERIVLDPEDYDEEEIAEEANIKYKPLSSRKLISIGGLIMGSILVRYSTSSQLKFVGFLLNEIDYWLTAIKSQLRSKR
jgi:hypothetical protein